MERPDLNLIGTNQLDTILMYAAELELEVDRLRRRDQFLQIEARDHVRETRRLCDADVSAPDDANPLSEIAEAIERFRELLRDMAEPPGCHSAFDQVVPIAVRPLAEQVFRWQQRVSGANDAIFRLDLQPDHIEWFPARLRHILDNLISNALRFRDASKGEVRVALTLRTCGEGYEFLFTDNGLGIPDAKKAGMLDLFYRAAPTKAAGLGVGLAVVKMLVEQCCGTISVTSGEGQGTSVAVTLPRFAVDDHVD